MAIIETIKITCVEQEDWTGTDDLKFNLDGVFKGTFPMSSGQVETIGRARILGELFVEPGTVLQIEEFDVDFNDVLLEHTITDADIQQGCITLGDQISSARYTFEICFVDF